MIYNTEITEGSGGSSASPTATALKLSAGVIHQVEIDFPPGCAGLVGVKIYKGGDLIFPIDGWLKADGQLLRFKEYTIIKPGYTHFRILTYNEDDTYDHTIQVRFAILKEYQINPYIAIVKMSKAVDRIGGLLGGFMSWIQRREKEKEEKKNGAKVEV